MTNEVLKQDVAVKFKTGTIELNNADQLKQLVGDYANKYEELVVTEESYSDDKKVRTDLNKLKKALEDKRKEIKRAYNQPLKEFESLIKEIEAPIDGVTKNIKEQTDKFDKQAKDKKRQQIQEFIDEECASKGISSENILINPKWLNKTTSKKAWQEDANNLIKFEETKQNSIKQDIGVVRTYATQMGIEPDSYIYQIKNGATAGEVMIRINSDIEKQAARQETKKATTKDIGNKRVDTTTGEVNDILSYKLTVKGSKQDLAKLHKFMSRNGIELIDRQLIGGNQ